YLEGVARWSAVWDAGNPVCVLGGAVHAEVGKLREQIAIAADVVEVMMRGENAAEHHSPACDLVQDGPGLGAVDDSRFARRGVDEQVGVVVAQLRNRDHFHGHWTSSARGSAPARAAARGWMLATRRSTASRRSRTSSRRARIAAALSTASRASARTGPTISR